MSTNYYPGETETAFEWSGEETEGGFNSSEVGFEDEEALESELAMELLTLNSEEELDQFLGKLARSVVRGASNFVKSPIGKVLGGALKSVIKTAAPMVGGALGSFIAPGVGTAIGSKLGSMAGSLLEAEEAEAMDEVQAEEEAARRYVRFARASIRNAARTPRSVPPVPAARAATRSAARMYAPSLLRPANSYSGAPRRYRPTSVGWGEPNSWAGQDAADEGRWIRRGGRVILLGL